MSDIQQDQASKLMNWITAYFNKLESFPVRAQTDPGDILLKVPDTAPKTPDDFDQILSDLDTMILPGLTHWQHPRFFAYFPANVHFESFLADMMISALGINAMLWETSPAATELEIRMIDWLKDLMGLPDNWTGFIQDTASASTLSAVITARELAAQGLSNDQGLKSAPPMAIYVSPEAHSSIEKAARIAGLGSASVRLVETDNTRAMNGEALMAAMQKDKENGIIPTLLVITAGGTGTGAFDKADEIIAVAKSFGAYVHVDAAWAGSIMLCEEYRTLFKGCEKADSFVFNPHKWLGVGFDCSVQFLKTAKPQIDAMTVKPVYLESNSDDMPNFSDWGIALGRRMRALKLWFVLRLVGPEKLKSMLRAHIRWAEKLAGLIESTPGFKIITPPSLSLLTFQYLESETSLKLLNKINNDGYTYLTKTTVDGEYAIRFQIGSITTTWQHVENSFKRITELALELES